MLLKLEEKKVFILLVNHKFLCRLGRKLKIQRRKLEKSCKLDKEMKKLTDKSNKECKKKICKKECFKKETKISDNKSEMVYNRSKKRHR